MSTVVALPYVRQDPLSNPNCGIATLSGGSVTISTPYATATSKVFLTYKGPTIGTTGRLYTGNFVEGVSFDILSTSGADNSNVYWFMILENTLSFGGGLTFGFPQLFRNVNYGSAVLSGTPKTIFTPYASNSAVFILSLAIPSFNDSTTTYHVEGIFDGSSFAIHSTTPGDSSTISWMIISSSAAPLANSSPLSYPILDGNAASNNYNIDQLSGGSVTINTSRIFSNSVVFNSTHTPATTISNTCICGYSTLFSPSRVQFNSLIPADDQRLNWFIIDTTNGTH